MTDTAAGGVIAEQSEAFLDFGDEPQNSMRRLFGALSLGRRELASPTVPGWI
jgi:hypothetical protein